jgi:hypothetical protein
LPAEMNGRAPDRELMMEIVDHNVGRALAFAR